MRIKYLYMTFVCSSILFSNVIDCNAIFEQRKDELTNEISKIENQKSLLTKLYDEKEALNLQKIKELQLKEQQIENMLNEVEMKENDIKELIKKNEELLASINEAKNNKISDTYTKMKDSKASAIIENMITKDAVELLNSMDSKSVSKVLSKMNPQKAAKLTELLKKGPPFDEIEE